MVDCPTGAIGRDPDGEVFIRAELCTGCGNCVRSCPWDNIQLAGAVAVKCDLCRGYQAPACVEACPTGSIVRLDPSRDIAEVAQVLGRPLEPRTDQTSHIRSSHITYVIISYLAGVVVAAAALGWLAGRGWTPGQGPGLAAGLIAAALIVGLAGYAIPKRLVRRRLAPRARGLRVEERAPRSRTRGPLALHLGLGALLPAAALAHAGLRAPSTPGGALVLALGATVVVGVLAAIAYRAVPPALTRLERRGALPEDLAGEADALSARLFRELSGTGERVKRVAERLLLPYAAARLGAVALVASGRSLGEEERRLRARIDAIVEGRALDGIDPLIRIAVERRALPARRALTALLRIWLPLHVVTAAMSAALLVAHVVTAVWS
jgi:ferredoxin